VDKKGEFSVVEKEGFRWGNLADGSLFAKL